MSHSLPSFSPHDPPPAPASPPAPPPVPDQPAPARDYDTAWFAPTTPVSAVYAVTEPDIQTATTDTVTPGDIFGDAWLHRHPQVLTVPIRPPTTTYALGHDVPASSGRVAMRVRTRAADGSAVHLDLPSVHILRHDAVPMLIGLQSHKRLNILVDTALDTIYTGSHRTPIPCRLRRGHLTLPPPPCPQPRPPPTTPATRSNSPIANSAMPVSPPSRARFSRTPSLRRTSPTSRP